MQNLMSVHIASVLLYINAPMLYDRNVTQSSNFLQEPTVYKTEVIRGFEE